MLQVLLLSAVIGAGDVAPEIWAWMPQGGYMSQEQENELIRVVADRPRLNGKKLTCWRIDMEPRARRLGACATPTIFVVVKGEVARKLPGFQCKRAILDELSKHGKLVISPVDGVDVIYQP